MMLASLIQSPDGSNNAKWMTLPDQSGNMSQLYRGFSLEFVDCETGRCDESRVYMSQFDPFGAHFASP